jgi:predicted ATP-grasp superfamily ATP-dependent carboligase
VPVVGFYYSDEHCGRASRLIRAYRIERRESAESLARQLLARSASFACKPVLLAASDEFAFLVTQAKAQLADDFSYHWMSSDSTAVVFDKPRMVRLCEQAGVCCPRTHVPQIGEQVAAIARRFSFPCVVKPVRSFRTAFPRDQKTYLAASPGALVDFYTRRPDLLGTTFWQEAIDGLDDEVYQCNVLLARSGALSAVCGVRKLRQHPVGYGNMCFGRTETNEALAATSLGLLRRLGYRGYASLEFKRSARDNRYYFIELNPRLPRYNDLLSEAGVNLPYLGYLDLIDGADPPAELPSAKENVYWVMAGEDRQSFLRGRAALPQHLFRWILSIAKARSFAWWNATDPAPFVRAVLGRLPRIAGQARSRTRPIQADDDPKRLAFDRQYANPHQVGAGPERFFLYDITPPHLTSNVPILFCPGWMENPHNHKETIYALYRLGRRTLFPDAPHGIDAPSRASLPPAQLRHAAALIATLQQRGVADADALAHSAGAISLAIAATADDAPHFRNVVLQSPAGLCGGQRVVSVAWHALQESRREATRQRCRPTERTLVHDPRRRKMHFSIPLARTVAEIAAIARADIRQLLLRMKQQGTLVAVVHGTDDRLFAMDRMQQHIDVNALDGFYSVEGGHQQILLEPSRYGRLAFNVLRELERKRRGAALSHDAAVGVAHT